MQRFHKIRNLVVIHKLPYQEAALTNHFVTVEQKCCLSRSALLNKKLLLDFVANKQYLFCKANLIYLVKIKTIFIVNEKLKIW